MAKQAEPKQENKQQQEERFLKEQQDKEPIVTLDRKTAHLKVPKHRKCPCCFGIEPQDGKKGIGTAYATKGNIRYYKCNNEDCNFRWTYDIKLGETNVEENFNVDLTQTETK